MIKLTTTGLVLTLMTGCGIQKPKHKHNHIVIKGGKQTCSTEEVTDGVRIDCPGEESVLIKHGKDGVRGKKGVSGVDGADGSAGTNMEVESSIVCRDDVPNYPGVRFEMSVTTFSTGDYHISIVMYDDENTLGAGTSWNKPVKVFRDKQLNDDWAFFTFYLDETEPLSYVSDYTDPVDGDETFTVANRCEAE